MYFCKLSITGLQGKYLVCSELPTDLGKKENASNIERFYCERKAVGGLGRGREQEGRSLVSEAGALEGVPLSKAFALTHAQTHLAHLC